jgi:hypothetical protein
MRQRELEYDKKLLNAPEAVQIAKLAGLLADLFSAHEYPEITEEKGMIHQGLNERIES